MIRIFNHAITDGNINQYIRPEVQFTESHKLQLRYAFYLFIDFKRVTEKNGETERDLLSLVHFLHNCYKQLWPDLNQEPRASSGLSTWISGIQTLEPSCIASSRDIY